MGDAQDDAYAERRATREAQFSSLPPAGSGDYWRYIEESDTARRLPLEVLARCCRERLGAGARSDAERIFAVIVARIDAWVKRQAKSTAYQAKAGMKPQLQQELEQECYMKLWEELATDGPTFLLEHFYHTLGYIFDHVAQSEMTKAGERKRDDVLNPKRVPSSQIDSIDAAPRGEDQTPLADRLVGTNAQKDLDLAEYADLLAEVEKLPPDERAIIRGLFFEGLTQQEVGEKLDRTDRTIRKRLKGILQRLRARYEDGEGGGNV